MWDESRSVCLDSGTCCCSAIHIYWSGVDRGVPKRARPSLLEYGLRDDSSRTEHQAAGIPCLRVASLLAALAIEWQGVIGEADVKDLYSVSSCSVHWP